MTMAEPNYSFRAALHGFNRTDVINYLSELTAAHAKQLEEKDAELLAAQEETARVKQELMCLRMLIGSEPEESEEPESETEAEPEAAPQPEPEQLPEPDADVPVVEQELEAYRRAERCEREARARAGKIYGEACDVVEKAKAQELCSNVATALNVYYQEKGRWPQALLNAKKATGGGKLLDENAALVLAKNNLMALSAKKDDTGKIVRLTGFDRFGVVSPWAVRTLKRLGPTAGSLSSRVTTGGTIADHILCFDLDEKGEGYVETSVGGVPVKVRANAIVWCAGRDGVLAPYPYAGGSGGGAKGSNKGGNAAKGPCDDIWSWTPRQVE